MSPTEQTPLIQVVPIGPPRDRYPHYSLRRFFTIVLTAIPLITIVVVLLALVLSNPNDFSDHHQTGFLSVSDYYNPVIHGEQNERVTVPHPSWPAGDGMSYDELKEILKETPNAEKAKEWSKYYTSGPHLAGKNLSQAVWTKERWQEFGILQSEIVAYDVYINYPIDHRLALLNNGSVGYEAKLEEDVLDGDETSQLPDRVPTFHGYSASGNVTAPYVFVNYGTYRDFEELQKANVSLEGKIALIKYGGIFRGLKVKRASELGMIGAVIYSDPGDDGEVTEEHGYEAYPDGPARNPSSVQRGSVQYLSIAPGDPTTPGYPSKPGAPRQPVDTAIPDIPSIPISYVDALPFLKALNGHGPSITSFPESWQSGGLAHKGVEYSIGPSPDDVMLNLVNEQEYVTTPLWNVIGIINGSIPDEVVVLGNHRDAWIAGGAGDPNSGSAAMNEVIRSFGAAVQKGWRPQRTIVFASWDGEEYGLIGSTEWVEEYLPWLSHATIAYLNVDVGARGTKFTAAAAPLLDRSLIEVTKDILSPNQTISNRTINDLWDGRIRTMGSGSDFTAFQDFAGIPCVDMGFGGGRGDPVYHYHSNYDSFSWMQKYGDPGFEYHIAIAKLWALLAAKLAEEPVVSFNASDYATALERYVHSVKDKIEADLDEGERILYTAPLIALEKAVESLQTVSSEFDTYIASLAELAASPNKPRTPGARAKLYAQVRTANTKLKYLERSFLYAPGLDGRNWFKHVVFAPGIWTGYAGATFPGLVEAVESSDKKAFAKWVGIITGSVHRAAVLLS
ncbi:hypothetical protein LTR66_001230 [Elasticomyces elasticus]|nr:hypothetical protein LTR66_001230 [Elasticomyces elasticus]